MALADLDTVKKRLIALLNANPGVWSASVSGGVGAFPDIAEITQACLEADSNVACQGYANSVNDSLANPFQVTTTPFHDRDSIPFHHGDLSKVELSKIILNLTSASINTTTDRVTSSSHGLVTGDALSFLIISGGLPSPLAAATSYYAIVIDANIFQLATTYANAVYAGTAIDLTTTGSGRWAAIAWIIGVEAANVDDITNATGGMESYVGSGSYDFLYKPVDGLLYTTATYWRATHFEYTQTAALQCNQNESSAIIFEGAAILVKNASPALFDTYKSYADELIRQLVYDGMITAQINEAGMPSPTT